MPGTLSRASAIAPPGMVLSQPTSTTRPSNPLPRATSSIESAITSRLISEARIPSVPIVMPSEIDTVLNSIGVAPAARTPAFTCSASVRRLRLHGPISIQVFAMPMSGFLRSASENPAPLSIARAGARLGPVVRGLPTVGCRHALLSREWLAAPVAAAGLQLAYEPRTRTSGANSDRWAKARVHARSATDAARST